MNRPLYLNGRFLSQDVTGVQRFGTEIISAMDQLAVSGEMPAMQILTPAGASAPRSGESYRCFAMRGVGHLKGHAWEQIELPVHARDGLLVSLGNSAPMLRGRTQVVVIHDAGVFDTPETYSRPFRLWYQNLWRVLAHIGVHIVTVSEFSRARIARRLRIDPGRIHIMREGGEHMLRFRPAGDILTKHGLQPGRFVLVVGSRVPHKNLSSLNDLAAMLATRGIAVAIAGSVDKAVFRSAENQSTSVIHTLGRVTDQELRALYEAATCLLFPTLYEGFGLPAVEAMSCHCPVITSGAGALQEVCGDAALYFDTAQPASVIAVVERLLDQPDLAADLRARGQSRVAIFNWANAARDLAGIIHTATTEKSHEGSYRPRMA